MSTAIRQTINFIRELVAFALLIATAVAAVLTLSILIG